MAQPHREKAYVAMRTPHRPSIDIPTLDHDPRWAAVEDALHALTLALLANTAALERWTRVSVANAETQRQQGKAQRKKPTT